MTSEQPALRLTGIRYVRDGRPILDGIDWEVGAGQRWVLLGPNGSGKSTLLKIASLYEHPTTGTVEVLGETLGRVDVRRHRERIGLTSSALADQLRTNLVAEDIVVCALHAALEPWWHTYSGEERARARHQLERLGCGHLVDHQFGTLSSGERQRVLLARTLMADPGLLLLDEPAAAMDLGGREQLVTSLDALAADPTAPPMILVTHHLEEIPGRFSHALLLREGRVVRQGPIDEVIDSVSLSDTFGLDLEVARQAGRWQAWSRNQAHS